MDCTKFRQIGNLLVDPNRVDAICFQNKEGKREISVALKCGGTWFFNPETDEAFNKAISQIEKIFNIGVEKP